jgi:CRP-like cAMP-binding protein
LNIDYFRGLAMETYEELINIMKSEVYQTGEIILNHNSAYDRIFILHQGEIELYFPLKNDIIEIDTLNEPGCVMNQIGCVIREKISYTAKALKSASLFTISYQDLLEIANHRKDLRKRLDMVVDKNNERSKPIIDFTSRRFYMEGDDGGI